jgi:hypothetical protein
LTLLYWQIGNRVRQDILKEKRAEYGEEIISTLSIQLVKEFGNGFSRPNLFRMVRFAEVFPEETPLGLILCAGKTSEQIELLQLDKSGIKVAEYMTELPKRELLEQKLHKAVELARKRLEAKPA